MCDTAIHPSIISSHTRHAQSQYETSGKQFTQSQPPESKLGKLATGPRPRAAQRVGAVMHGHALCLFLISTVIFDITLSSHFFLFSAFWFSLGIRDSTTVRLTQTHSSASLHVVFQSITRSGGRRRGIGRGRGFCATLHGSCSFCVPNSLVDVLEKWGRYTARRA